MAENKDIELRSEKVRNIIGQIPSLIVRMGITVIFIVVLVLLGGAYFIRFDYTIGAQAQLHSTNKEIHYTIKVPQNKIKHIRAGQQVTITIHKNSLTTTLQTIDTTLYLSSEQAYYNVHGVIGNCPLQVTETIQAPSKIRIGKTNAINYVLNK